MRETLIFSRSFSEKEKALLAKIGITSNHIVDGLNSCYIIFPTNDFSSEVYHNGFVEHCVVNLKYGDTPIVTMYVSRDHQYDLSSFTYLREANINKIANQQSNPPICAMYDRQRAVNQAQQIVSTEQRPIPRMDG